MKHTITVMLKLNTCQEWVGSVRTVNKQIKIESYDYTTLYLDLPRHITCYWYFDSTAIGRNVVDNGNCRTFKEQEEK